MVRIGIAGATGYGGRELLRLLLAHPEAEITALTSTSVVGESLDEVLPAFRKMTELAFEPFDPVALAERCDVVFIAAHATQSMGMAAQLRAAGVRVIDIGPDFRLQDVELFAKYYKAPHEQPGLLAEAVYGMVPMHREVLYSAQLVAVPGCYPISVILPLWPLTGGFEGKPVVIADSVSGISGAGRTPAEAFHFPEMSGNMKAYKVGVHQHIPEIEQALGNRCLVQFTPHVAPLARGILSTLTLAMPPGLDPAALYAAYDEEPFVRVLGEGTLAEVKHVRGTNFCDLGWVCDERTGNLVIVSAIDNLMGGTAGMAVQCMNLMFGLDETTGLRYGGMAP